MKSKRRSGSIDDDRVLRSGCGAQHLSENSVEGAYTGKVHGA